MGKHLDGLVDIANEHLKDKDPFAKEILRIVNKAQLYELGFHSNQIIQKSQKPEEEFNEDVRNYLLASAEYGHLVAMPHSTTAIEDLDSVVIFDPIEGKYGEYNVVIGTALAEKAITSLLYGSIAYTPTGNPETLLSGFSKSKYFVQVGSEPFTYDERKDGDTEDGRSLAHHISTAARSFIEQVVMIMDPAIFIVEKETPESKSQFARYGAKKVKLMRTINRPIYTISHQKDVQKFLEDRTKAPVDFTPVSGYWKEFRHPKFVNVRGVRQYVGPYAKGGLIFEAPNRITYRVLIKEGLNKIIRPE